MDDPEPDPNTVIFTVIYCLLTLFSLLVTMGTSALKEVNEKKLRDCAEDGDKSAIRLLRLLDHRPKPTDISAASTALCSTLGITSALLGFWPKYANKGLCLSDYGTIQEYLYSVVLSGLVITLLASAVFAIFGLMLPRRLGKQNHERLSATLSGILTFTKILIWPFTALTSGIARLLVKIFGGDPHVDEAPVTEDEILSMVDEGEESGVLEEIEKEMINNIFEFGDLTAGEVMTHRTYLTAAEVNEPLSEVVAKAIDAGCSRLPVYEDELDNIKGILYVKDLLGYVGSKIPGKLKPSDLMREAMFIPESKKCRDLLTEMIEKHLQMVIVADEYGGVAGIVTVEDLIEAIVGNIQDEFDDENEEIEQISEDKFSIDGISAISEVDELLGIELPEGEYETIAGYMMSILGRVPEVYEHPAVYFGGYSFTVAEMDERRILRIAVERLPETDTFKDSDKEK